MYTHIKVNVQWNAKQTVNITRRFVYYLVKIADTNVRKNIATLLKFSLKANGSTSFKSTTLHQMCACSNQVTNELPYRAGTPYNDQTTPIRPICLEIRTASINIIIIFK